MSPRPAQAFSYGGGKQSIAMAVGLPEPPRSACWMCPLRSDQEWVELVRDAPEDFAQAIELEQEIRERDPDVFLHRSAVPIDQVEFRARPGEVAGQCSLGLCMV